MDFLSIQWEVFMESLIPKISNALKYLYETCDFDSHDRRFEIGKKLHNIAAKFYGTILQIVY